MRKFKLFLTLLTLVIFGCGQMWGADTNPNAKGTFKAMVSNEALVAGDTVIIVSSKNNNYVAMSTDQRSNNRGVASVTVSSSTITLGGSTTVQALAVSASSVSNAWTLYTGSGYLYAPNYNSGTSNYLKTDNADKSGSGGDWVISYNSVAANGNGTRRFMKYNSGNNPPIISCYQSSSTEAVTVYKKAHKVKYNANGGTMDCSDNTFYKSNTSVTICTSVPERDNYNFTGWVAKDAHNNTISIAAGKLTMPASDVTLTAQWEEAGGCSTEVSVSKGSTEHGSFTLGATSVCADGDGGEVAIASVTPDGCYEFDEIIATVGTPDNTNMKVTGINAATTITVKFKKKTVNTYIDEVQDNGSQEFCAAHNAPTLTDKAVNTTGTAQEQHFHFVGWVTEANRYNATDQNVIAGGTEMTVTGTTYYAVWAKQASAASLESDVINYAATSSDLSGKASGWYDLTVDGSTGAKYQIHSMQTSGNVALQWNANGYLYCSQKPTSGAKLKSVSVTTTANKNIGLYGSANVYAAAATETSLGTLAATSSGATYNFTSTYYAIGLKGMASSTSISSITITYGEDATYNHYRTIICDELAEMSKSVIDPSQEYLTLKWSALTGVTSWSVQYKVQGAADNTYANVTTSSKTTSDGFNLWTITGLEAGTTYTFKIVATAFDEGVCTDVNTWTVDGATQNNYEVTAQSNNKNYGTVSLSGSTITASPKDGYRVSQETPYTVSVANAVDVAQNGNVFTISNLSNSCTITINFEAIPTYAVNWYVNGTSQKNQTYREGTLVSTIMADAPSVLDNALNASCGSTKFVGWVTEAYTGNEGTISTYNNSKVDGEATLSAAANYYAMFATATTDDWSRVETLGGITAGTYVIVNDGHALPNTVTGNSAPAYGTAVTVDGTTHKITSTVAADMQWNFAISEGKYVITNADGKYLYETNNNNGLRVGETEDTWTIAVNTDAPAYSLKGTNNNRYCATYSEQDWRSYTDPAHGNYADGGQVYLFKHTAIYGEYRTGCTCNTVTVAIGTHTNGTLTLDEGNVNVSHETCTASSVEVRVAPNATYQFAATNAVTFNMGTTGLTAPDSYETDGDARVYTVSIPKGTAAGTITVNATFVSLPKYGINLSGVSHLTNLASTPATEALGGETVTLSYDDVEDGYTFLNWIVKGATTNNTIPVTNNQFQMPNDEGVVVTADIRENVSVAFYVGTTPFGEAAETYQGGTISLPATDPTESFDATNYPNFIGWSATNFGAATSAPTLVTGDETINASTSYYAVFANEATAGTNNYQKIDYTATLSGNYIIAAYASSTYKAMRAEKGQYNLNSTTVTVNENVINNEDALLVWNITQDANTNYVKLKNGSNWATIVYDGSQYTNLILTSNDAANQFTIAENNAAEDAYVFTTTESIDRNEIEYHNGFTAYNGQDAPIYLFKQVLAPTKWATKQIEEVTVSFNDNVAEEDITVPANQVVESGDDLDLSGFTPGTRAGYQFAGWSLTTDGAVVASLSNITEPTPLYAIWTANPNCTIKFSVRGTVKDALQETVLQGLTFSGFASKEIAEADEVEGYDFIGWASAAQLAETTDAITPMTSYTPEVEENASEVTVYALYKRVSAGADVTDEITASQLPATSGYYSFDDVTITSDAVYAGATAYSGGNIQINNNANPNKGIVSITSGGILKSIAITWGSSSNTLDIYASNAAYEEIGELYGNTPKGEVVHSFTATGSYTFEDDYSYIGIRSHSGAIYLSKISITWATSTTYYTTRPTQLWAVEYNLNGGAWKSGEGCADETVQEGEYTVCTDVPVNGEDKLFDKWQIKGVDVTTATVNITEATTFTAVWKDRGHGKVTYSANGGVISGSAPAAADVWEDEKVTVVANTFFTNPGYSFGGWDITYNDGENIQTITPDANNQFDMPAYDVTIAAVWSRKSTDKWTRVTSAGQLVPGTKYVIANVDATYAMGGQNTNNRAAIEIDKVKEDGSIITISESVKEFTLGGSIDAWTFQDASGYLYAASSSSNYLRSQETNDENGQWSITITNGETTITAQGENTRNILRYNENVNQQTQIANPIFSCYASNSSVQNPVNLYMKAPKVDVTTDVDASVITAEGTDVTIKNGGILNINAEKSVGDVHVENGGQIALTQNLAAHDLYIESKAGQSAQVSGADKITLSGNLYMDIQLCNGSLDANYWYSIAVPFDVNLNDGVFLADNTPLMNRSDFEVWGYNTTLRAQTQSNGWERVKDNMMHAGKAYLIGFNPGQPNIIRLKAAEGWQDRLFTEDELSVVSTGGSGDHDNWNGLANPTMRYIDIDKDAQVFNNNSHQFDPFSYDAQAYNFVVGTAFFVQSASSVTISNEDHGQYRAPKRESENKCAFAVRITRAEAEYFDNQIIVRASEEATGEYTQDHDMLTMNGTSSNTAALLWTENYGGKRLAIEEAAWLNGTATYELKMYAPKAGTYHISVAEAKANADLYLTYEGAIIWDLTMGEYTAELPKGITEGYGLLLVKKAPSVTTGIENGEVLNGANGVQKIVLDDKVFILRGGQMYDVTGKAVR